MYVAPLASTGDSNSFYFKSYSLLTPHGKLYPLSGVDEGWGENGGSAEGGDGGGDCGKYIKLKKIKNIKITFTKHLSSS